MILILAQKGKQRSEAEEHTVISERIGLDPFEIKELRHALVIGLQELLIHLVGYGGPLDFHKPMPAEEIALECQTEDSVQSESARALKQ